MRRRTLNACLYALAVSGCAPVTHTAQFRSPSHDYPSPARTTADGEVLGADRKPIADRLAEQNPPETQEKR